MEKKNEKEKSTMKNKRKKNRSGIQVLLLVIFIALFLSPDSKIPYAPEIQKHIYSALDQGRDFVEDLVWEQEPSAGDVTSVPAYEGKPYVLVNNGEPYFDEYSTDTFYQLSQLDNLGRCGTAYACVGPESLAKGERGAIGHIKPSGWHTVKYNDIVEGNYLYNRCHLLMWALTGLNDEEKNLITGTRYMNTEGMLPFEEKILEYIENTGNHVMYRVTPIFTGSNLLASGVQMEAASVEDEAIRINVYCYNVQPGIKIDYRTGDSRIS